MTTTYCRLDWRSAIAVEGPDAETFLQGLVSNDVRKATPERAIWAAFLTPQGKFLHEFSVVRDPAATEAPRYLLECEHERRAHLIKRLSLYRLRAKVTIGDMDDTYAVYAATGDAAHDLGLGEAPGAAGVVDGALAWVDPRRAELGVRLLVPSDQPDWWHGRNAAEAGPDEWDRQRIALGVPDGSRDLEVEKSILLENGFAELNGVDWDKGCFLGQELTARTHYRALIRKRLMPLKVEGELPAAGTVLQQGDREVGTVHAGNGDHVLAMVKLDALDGDPITTGDGAVLAPALPDWLSNSLAKTETKGA